MGQVGRYKDRGFCFLWKRSEPTVTFLKHEDLSFCFSWFYSTDISVGFVGLIFQRIQTESPYDKSVTWAVFCINAFSISIRAYESCTYETRSTD